MKAPVVTCVRQVRGARGATGTAGGWTGAGGSAIVPPSFSASFEGQDAPARRLRRVVAVRMTIGTRIFTWLRGELVGTDSTGNRYYRDKAHPALSRGGGRASRERRWVLYNGVAEASRVPSEWHGWLHHSSNVVPTDGGRPRYPWEKPHQPNLTGTPLAYRPPGSVLRGGERAHAAGDYEPWRPDAEDSPDGTRGTP